MPVSPSRRRRPAVRFRLGALAALPFALAAVVCAVYYGNLHRTTAAMAESSMAPFPGPAPGDRLLVVAPHCDDETLGAGGLIETARRRGVPVTVVFLTHGDGFRIAASLALREVSPGPSDYLRFGEHRRAEAIAALTRLGVAPADVHFLGYPDQGLKMIWETTSGSDQPFTSRFTKTDHVPYPSAFHRGAPHTAQSVVSDLAGIIETVRPTDVLTTHPADDHGDHGAAAAIVQAALLTADQTSERVRNLHFFLVHRGDWPLPQGYHPDESIKPPAAFSALGPSWRTFTLDTTARAAKRSALFEYRSQMDVMPRLLKSFLRRNEIFVTVDPRNPVLFADQPVGDDIARYAQAGADFSGLGCTLQKDRLAVDVRLRGKAAPGLRYVLHVRALDAEGRLAAPVTRATTISLTEPRTSSLNFSVPISVLGVSVPPRAVFFGVEAGMDDRLPIDRTGYQCVVADAMGARR